MPRVRSNAAVTGAEVGPIGSGRAHDTSGVNPASWLSSRHLAGYRGRQEPSAHRGCTELGLQKAWFANMKKPRILHAQYERQPDGTWLASLREEPRVRTFGRTLDRAEESLRDAAAIWCADDLEGVVWSHAYFGLPADVFEPLFEARALAPVYEPVIEARGVAEENQRRALDLLAKAAKELTNVYGLGRRDTARLLHVSHQRVSQLLNS